MKTQGVQKDQNPTPWISFQQPHEKASQVAALNTVAYHHHKPSPNQYLILSQNPRVTLNSY